MNCKKCGKLLKLNEKETCYQCSKSRVHTDLSPDDFWTNFEVESKEKRKKEQKEERKVLIAIIIVGFFCPLIWIIYILRKNWDKISKILPYIASGSSSAGSVSRNVVSSEDEEGLTEKEFLITGGDGNIYISGGMFCDWKRNYIEWGNPFYDHRGNYIGWGEPFYDNRDNYITWGSPFYDAGDNYINPR